MVAGIISYFLKALPDYLQYVDYRYRIITAHYTKPYRFYIQRGHSFQSLWSRPPSKKHGIYKTKIILYK